MTLIVAMANFSQQPGWFPFMAVENGIVGRTNLSKMLTTKSGSDFGGFVRL